MQWLPIVSANGYQGLLPVNNLNLQEVENLPHLPKLNISKNIKVSYKIMYSFSHLVFLGRELSLQAS